MYIGNYYADDLIMPHGGINIKFLKCLRLVINIHLLLLTTFFRECVLAISIRFFLFCYFLAL